MSRSNHQAQPQKPVEGSAAPAPATTPFMEYSNAAAYYSQAAASYNNSASYHRYMADCYSNDAIHYSNLSVSYGYIAASFGNKTAQPTAHHNVLGYSLPRQQGGFPTQAVPVRNPVSHSSHQNPSIQMTTQSMAPQPNVRENDRMNGLGCAEWTSTELGEQLEEEEMRERELEMQRKKQQEVEKKMLAEKRRREESEKITMEEERREQQETKNVEERIKSDRKRIMEINKKETEFFMPTPHSESQETPILISIDDDEEREESLSSDLLDFNPVSEMSDETQESSQDSFERVCDDLDVSMHTAIEYEETEENETTVYPMGPEFAIMYHENPGYWNGRLEWAKNEPTVQKKVAVQELLKEMAACEQTIEMLRNNGKL